MLISCQYAVRQVSNPDSSQFPWFRIVSTFSDFLFSCVKYISSYRQKFQYHSSLDKHCSGSSKLLQYSSQLVLLKLCATLSNRTYMKRDKISFLEFCYLCLRRFIWRFHRVIDFVARFLIFQQWYAIQYCRKSAKMASAGVPQ